MSKGKLFLIRHALSRLGQVRGLGKVKGQLRDFQPRQILDLLFSSCSLFSLKRQLYCVKMP